MILTNPTRIRNWSDIPPLGTGRNAKDEDKLWRELIAAVFSLPALGHTWRKRAGKLEALANEGSDNHAALSYAIHYLVEPDKPINGMTGREMARLYPRLMLGLERERASGDAGYFQASEPASNNYDGYTVGAWLAILDRALETGDTETVKEWMPLIYAWCAVTALMSSTPVPQITRHAVDGTTTIRNPSATLTRLSVGSRSTPHHLHADPAALILTDLIGFPGSHPHPDRDPFDYFYLIISGRRSPQEWGISREFCELAYSVISGDVREGVNRLASYIPATARWVGHIEVWRGESQIVGFVPKCLNGNTGWNTLSIIEKGKVLHNWNPWPTAKSKELGTGYVRWEDVKRYEVDEVLNCAEIRTGSTFIDFEPAIVVDYTSARRLVFDRDGFRLDTADADANYHYTSTLPQEPIAEPVEPTSANDTTRPDSIHKAAQLIRALNLARKQQADQIRILSSLEAGRVSVADVATVKSWFRADSGQKQADAWREAVKILETMS
jgi:hypothetical protein